MLQEDPSAAASKLSGTDSLALRPQGVERFSPIRLFAATILGIFAAEVLTMWAVDGHRPGPVSLDFVLDAGGLILVAAPLAYLLLYRPLVRNLKKRIVAEKALRAVHEELEGRVAQRTAELEALNRRLREEAEDRRRADARNRFQSELLDNVEQGVIATNLEGRILFWNRFSERLYGWPADEVYGRLLSELFPDTPGYDHAGDICPRLGEGQEWAGEVDLCRKDGTFFPAHVSCFPVLDEHRRPAGIVHLSTDITGRRDAASALEYSEKKYSTLVESSPTGVFIAREGRMVFVNPRMEAITGYSKEELNESEWGRLLHEEDRPGLQRLAERTRAGEDAPRSYECRVVTKAGAVRWVDVRWTPISYRGSFSVIGSVQDVTESKEAERALARSEEALHQLSARLLTAQEDERRRVARDLHDGIGQTLSAIKFTLERSLSANRPEERRAEVPALRAIIPTIQDAMEEVRRISMALRPSILDDLGLFATLGWMSRELRAAHPEMRLETRFEAEEGEIPEPLKIVIFRISQEATNNALKHSHGSRILLGLRRWEGGLELTVEDDGVGFKLEEAEKARSDGRGLGLGTMRERAELSGGAFSLTPGTDAGTVVRVRWPFGVAFPK